MNQLLEYSAVVTALLCVILAVLERRSSWVLAIISSALYMPIFWSAELYWDGILQLFFIATSVYGYVEWGHTKEELPITRRSAKFHVGIAVASSLIAGVLVLFTQPSNIWVGCVDACIFTFSIAAALLIGRKIFDGWHYWLVIDSVASVLYFYKGLWGTGGLYVVYVFLVVAALRRWGKAIQPAAQSHPVVASVNC